MEATVTPVIALLIAWLTVLGIYLVSTVHAKPKQLVK